MGKRFRKLKALLLTSAMCFNLLMPKTSLLAADEPKKLDPSGSINGKQYVYSSDYATRIHYGAKDEDKKYDLNHNFIQNGAKLERVPDPAAEAQGKVRWRATFNRDRLEIYGDGRSEDLDGASAHTSNPYFSIILSKGIKFDQDRVLISAYWKDQEGKVVSRTQALVPLSASTSVTNAGLEMLKHPSDENQKLASLYYNEEINNVENKLAPEHPFVYEAQVYSSIAAFLRQSDQVEMDPSNEGSNPRAGGYSWSKVFGKFSELSDKEFCNRYAGNSGIRTNSDKASRVLNIQYQTPGTSSPAKQKNAMFVFDFYTVVDPAYTEVNGADKENFVFASYKSYDDNSTYMRGDIINITPIANASETKEQWKLKVDEAADDKAKYIPSHQLVIGTNGAGTYLDPINNTKGDKTLTKDYLINSPVSIPEDEKNFDPVYIGIADVDGNVLPFYDTKPDVTQEQKGTYGGYDFAVKQASPYDSGAKQSHWSVNWTKRDDFGTGFTKEGVTRVKIINPPIKTDYLVGENLDLTGMMVELTDAAGNKLIVTPDEFEDYGLVVDPAANSKLDKEGEIPVNVSSKFNEEAKDSTNVNVGAKIIEVTDENSEVPEGYVRFKFSAGEGQFADGKTVKYLDIKKGTTGKELKDSGKVPVATAENKLFDKWNPELPGDTVEIGDGTSKEYTALFKEDPASTTTTEATTTATTTEATTTATTTEATTTATTTEATTTATTTEATTTATTTEATTTATTTAKKLDKPVVDPIHAGDNNIKVGEPLEADKIEITLPDGSTVVVNKDADGNWKTGDGKEVPVENGKLIVPVNPDKIVEDGEVKVIAKKGDSVSDPTKVTIGKPRVIEVTDKDSEVPDGYIRMEFAAGEGSYENGETAKYIDVLKGTTGKELEESGKVPTPNAPAGKSFDKWDPELPGENDVIGDDTDTEYRATYKADTNATTTTEATTTATTTEPTTSATTTEATTTATTTEATTTATTTEPTTSATTTEATSTATTTESTTSATTAENTTAPTTTAVKLDKPTVDPIHAGDNNIKVGEPLIADKIEITLPDGSKIIVSKDENGNWKTGDGVTVPVENNKLIIPVDSDKTTEGGTVTVIAKKGDSVSEPNKIVIGKPEGNNNNGKPSKPEVDPIHAGDNNIKVGEPLIGDKIEITLPDGSKIIVNKDDKSNWKTDGGVTVPVENGKLIIPVNPSKLPEGGTVTVVVKKGDSVSDMTKVIIGKPSIVFNGGNANVGGEAGDRFSKTAYKQAVAKTGEFAASYQVIAFLMLGAATVLLNKKNK